MLSWLRSATTSIVAKALLALLVLSFAAWGVGDMLRVGGGGAVAEVGDEEITIPQFRREFDMALQSYGGGMTPSQARALGVDQIVLSQMAGRVALDQETAALGVDAPDEEVDRFIRDAPAFQNAAGDFDDNAFQFALRRSGLRAGEFHENVRRDIARLALVTAVQDGGVYPRAAAEAVWLNANETRHIDYLTLTPADFDPIEAPTDGELRAFYEDEIERFTAPEYRTATYLWIRADDRADLESVTDDEIEAEYERRADEYNRPERRNIERIDYDSEAEATEAAARIADGETFERLAADRGLEPADVALGYVTKADLFDETSVEAVFGDAREGLVGPVKTDFGWALFNIEGVIDAETTSIDEARDELARAVAIDIARGGLPDLANAVEDARAGGATLMEIGEKEKLLARQVVIDANGFGEDGERVADLPADPRFLQTAFQLEPGEERDLIELPGLEYVAVQVDAIEPPTPRDFETVRDDVEAAWRRAAEAEALEGEAARLIERLAGGETIAAIGETFDQEPQRFENLSRAGSTGVLSSDVVTAAFDAAEGDGFDAAAAGGDRRVVGVVVEIVSADLVAGREEIELVLDRAAQSVEADFLQLFQDAALAERNFTANPTGIAAAFNPGGYAGGHGGGM